MRVGGSALVGAVQLESLDPGQPGKLGGATLMLKNVWNTCDEYLM